MSKKTAEAGFEQQLSELEAIVKKMESGDLSLEQALKHFEQGVKLTHACQQTLEQAKLKIQQLTESGLQPLSTDTEQD